MDLTQNTVINDSPVSEEDVNNGSKKSCTDCKTSKTPLWRYGPAGPKTLCNACGIRYRKKISDLGLNKSSSTKTKKERSNHTSTSPKSGTENNNLSKSLKMGLMVLGKEVVMLQRQRSSIVRKQRRRVIGEEEEAAAVLLLSLSCGSVFA